MQKAFAKGAAQMNEYLSTSGDSSSLFRTCHDAQMAFHKLQMAFRKNLTFTAQNFDLYIFDLFKPQTPLV